MDFKPLNFNIDIRKEDIRTLYLEDFSYGY